MAETTGTQQLNLRAASAYIGTLDLSDANYQTVRAWNTLRSELDRLAAGTSPNPDLGGPGPGFGPGDLKDAVTGFVTGILPFLPSVGPAATIVDWLLGSGANPFTNFLPSPTDIINKVAQPLFDFLGKNVFGPAAGYLVGFMLLGIGAWGLVKATGVDKPVRQAAQTAQNVGTKAAAVVIPEAGAAKMAVAAKSAKVANSP